MKQFVIGLCILITAMPVVAERTLAGALSDTTLEQSGNPYVVTDNLTIKSGKRLVIKEGTVILFKPFTGIIVEGSLSIEGTLDKPVIFTTINDSKYNPQSKLLPNPFDWNGIFITQQAQNVKLSNFILEYSVYGVKSQKDAFIIDNGTFTRNGQFHVTVEDTIKNVVDNIPFNYSTPASTIAENKPMDKPGVPRSWKRPTAIGLGAAGLGTVGLGCFFLYRSSDYASQYSSATAQDKMDDFATKQASALNAGIISVIGGGLLIAGGAALFIWDLKSSTPKAVSISPSFGTGQGIAITFSF
jgi:hypothetical protein